MGTYLELEGERISMPSFYHQYDQNHQLRVRSSSRPKCRLGEGEGRKKAETLVVQRI